MARVATSCDTWPVKPRLPEQSRPDIRNNHGNRLCGRKKKAFVRTKKNGPSFCESPPFKNQVFRLSFSEAALPHPLGLPSSSLTPPKGSASKGLGNPYNQDSKAVNAWRTGYHGEHRADRISSALSSEHPGSANLPPEARDKATGHKALMPGRLPRCRPPPGL